MGSQHLHHLEVQYHRACGRIALRAFLVVAGAVLAQIISEGRIG